MELTKLLGVQEGQVFIHPSSHHKYRVYNGVREFLDSMGRWQRADSEESLIKMMLTPDKITIVPELSEYELNILRPFYVFGFNWLTRNDTPTTSVWAYTEEPVSNGSIWYCKAGDTCQSASFPVEMFPSVSRNDKINLSLVFETNDEDGINEV